MTGPWQGPRAVCDRCLRPVSVCVCAHLPALSPRTRVLILQHPKERRVAIGTARMAARCLRGSTVAVGTHFGANPDVRRALSDPARPAVLLWPGPDAVDVATSPPAGPITLVVVDGTWTTAKSLLRTNPEVAALPRLRIDPTAPSEYRIRREPRAECLSTIEAIAHALGVLEGDPAPYRAMLRPFRAMVDAQLAFVARGGAPRDRSRLLRRVRPVWAPPTPLADRARVVVVAVEANAWPRDAKERHPDELVQWLAVRADGSARCELVVRPSHPLAPSVTRHTGLSSEELLAGSPRETLPRDVAAFLREGDALLSWGTYAGRMMTSEGLAPADAVWNLRRMTADALRRSPSSIDRCAERLGLAPAPLGRGRGGRRLASMAAVFEALLVRAGV